MEQLRDVSTFSHLNHPKILLDTSGILFPIDVWSKKENVSNTEIELFKKYQKLITVTDLVMLDIKHIDEEGHRQLTGFSNKAILAFAKFLDDLDVRMWIRHVVVPKPHPHIQFYQLPTLLLYLIRSYFASPKLKILIFIIFSV